jgi:predicted Zn-dependent protease
MSGPDDVAGHVLDLVRAADATAQAEVVVDRTERALTRFANSAIHQNVAACTATVTLRLHAGGRTAGGSTTAADPDGLRDLVERTVAAARLWPPDPQWPGLAPPEPVAPPGPTDPDTAYAEPAARADRVRSFIKAAGGLETAGFCSTLRWSMTFVNSAGQSAWAETAEAAMDAIARAGTADGVARLAAPRLAEIDGTVLGARAATKARAGADPVELAPGRYEVVLEPTAVFDVLERMATYGVNGTVANEHRSFVEIGAAQLDPAITLVDDVAGLAWSGMGTAGLPFDIEGTPRRRLVLVDGGVCAAVTHDRRSAAIAGERSTGHAMPGADAVGTVAAHLHLMPATATATETATTTDGAGRPVGPREVDGPPADSAVADLVARVERGLLVTDNWYTRVLDPRTLVVTGLTRNGVWLIEDGHVATPVQNLRFTQSYPDALAAGAVLTVGAHAVALAGGWNMMTYRVPALRLASWNYTGNASG